MGSELQENLGRKGHAQCKDLVKILLLLEAPSMNDGTAFDDRLQLHKQDGPLAADLVLCGRLSESMAQSAACGVQR